MNFLALNDDAQFIISKHLRSDFKSIKKFMTKCDDDLQKKLFGEVKEMKIEVDDMCIDLKKQKKIDDEIEFLKKRYYKIHTYIRMYIFVSIYIYVYMYVCIRIYI
jgi:hypothetical protein